MKWDRQASQNETNPFFFFAAENLITILQARDGLPVVAQSPPVRPPEGSIYNSHGSSVHESPSERESPAKSLLVLRVADKDVGGAGSDDLPSSPPPPLPLSGLPEHAQHKLHLSRLGLRAGRTGRRAVGLRCRPQARRQQRDAVKGSTVSPPAASVSTRRKCKVLLLKRVFPGGRERPEPDAAPLQSAGV